LRILTILAPYPIFKSITIICDEVLNMRVVVATLVVKAFEAVHIGSFDPVLRLNQVTIANRPTPPWPLLVPCCGVRFQNLGPLVAFRVIFQVGVGAWLMLQTGMVKVPSQLGPSLRGLMFRPIALLARSNANLGV